MGTGGRFQRFTFQRSTTIILCFGHNGVFGLTTMGTCVCFSIFNNILANIFGRVSSHLNGPFQVGPGTVQPHCHSYFEQVGQDGLRNLYPYSFTCVIRFGVRLVDIQTRFFGTRGLFGRRFRFFSGRGLLFTMYLKEQVFLRFTVWTRYNGQYFGLV